MEVDVGYHIRDMASMSIVTICVGSNCHVLKVHMIFSQCACLIAKNMLDLPQLFIERTSLHNDFSRLCGIKSRLTNVNTLDIFDHFQRNYQGNRNKISKQQNPAAPLY